MASMATDVTRKSCVSRINPCLSGHTRLKTTGQKWRWKYKAMAIEMLRIAFKGRIPLDKNTFPRADWSMHKHGRAIVFFFFFK